jgi:hypothetical protein
MSRIWGEIICVSRRNLPELYEKLIALTGFDYFYSFYAIGRRDFDGWGSKEAAALHLTAVARGFLARKRLSHNFRQRYSTLACPFSSYLYFLDSEHPQAETSWYKPRLALPDDIRPYEVIDEEDFMRGKKFSDINFAAGPLYTTGKFGKGSKIHAIASIEAFHKPNLWRDQAINTVEAIDIETSPLGSIIAWLDGSKTSR